MGGATGLGGASDGGAPSSSCEFSISSSMSEVISTVGIIEWSVGGTVQSARVEFGLDTNYGMTAPVDLAEPGYRTLLLGMKGGRDYHYRVVASVDGQECASEDGTLSTGEIPNSIERPEISTPLPAQLSGGYLITGRWGDGNRGPSFILDVDGDVVWWYPAPDDVMRTRFSYDGKWMWMRNTAQTNGTGLVRRVTLDGLVEEEFRVPTSTHDLAVLPDGHLGLIAHAAEGCDEILDFDPADGSSVSIFNASEAHGASSCHVNFLAYSEHDDTFVFSDWETSSFVKITRQGELVWVLNGTASDFTGTSWLRQHAMHMFEPNHFVMFNNGDIGQDSFVLEYTLDLNSWTANELWRYDAGISASFGGDVQRMDNGNTVISYSSAGVIQEVTATGDLVQEMVWPIGYAVSYIVKRDSLYGGPPPRL